MRGGVPRMSLLAGLASALVGTGVSVSFGSGQPLGRGQGKPGRIYGAANIKRHLQRQKRTWGATGSLAGQPHEHKREIARRLRQAERDRQNREARGVPGVMGFSRSHLTCYVYAEGKVFRGCRQVGEV